MELEEYYGEALPTLREAEQTLWSIVNACPAQESVGGVQPVIYCKSRIKKPDSMMRKLASRGLSTDAGTALREMHDAVGMRVVCSFVDDVYEVSRWLQARDEYEVLEVKDYISYPKPNGYRSLHLILRFTGGRMKGLQAEIQLRTIAIDFWAALEHQMKYKQAIDGSYEKIVREELKRCADEIASVDISMQTIRDLLCGKEMSTLQ
ncbi:MAG: RelA/SpoT domain protein [Lachnospiraceae bacterium]|nr:RelA/SpoT domain protein [Lachnospiraceae bacterium]